MPEFMNENLEAKHIDGEIHPGETTEEKISLSERFGLWLSFYPFDQGSTWRSPTTGWKRSRQGRRRFAQGLAALGARARLAQRRRGVAVRARLRGRKKK